MKILEKFERQPEPVFYENEFALDTFNLRLYSYTIIDNRITTGIKASLVEDMTGEILSEKDNIAPTANSSLFRYSNERIEPRTNNKYNQVMVNSKDLGKDYLQGFRLRKSTIKKIVDIINSDKIIKVTTEDVRNARVTDTDFKCDVYSLDTKKEIQIVKASLAPDVRKYRATYNSKNPQDVKTLYISKKTGKNLAPTEQNLQIKFYDKSLEIMQKIEKEDKNMLHAIECGFNPINKNSKLKNEYQRILRKEITVPNANVFKKHLNIPNKLDSVLGLSQDVVSNMFNDVMERYTDKYEPEIKESVEKGISDIETLLFMQILEYQIPYSKIESDIDFLCEQNGYDKLRKHRLKKKIRQCYK